MKDGTEDEIQLHKQIRYASASAQMSNKYQSPLAFKRNQSSEVKQITEGLTAKSEQWQPGLRFSFFYIHCKVSREISI